MSDYLREACRALSDEFNSINESKQWGSKLKGVDDISDDECQRFGYSFNIGMDERNFARNRYRNIFPYDQWRVTIRSSPRNPDGYVNASHVAYEYCNANYILGQSPVLESCEDFWCMILEAKAPLIIMLNKPEEHSSSCEYFPPTVGDSATFSSIKITLLEENKFQYFIHRRMKVNEGSVTHELHHVQYIGWSDFGVPCNTDSILEMLRFVRGLNVLSKSVSDPPCVIHCLAGVGRSGTLLLIDCFLRMIEMQKPVSELNVLHHLTMLRRFRPYLIQTSDQLFFAWKTIVRSFNFTFDLPVTKPRLSTPEAPAAEEQH